MSVSRKSMHSTSAAASSPAVASTPAPRRVLGFNQALVQFNGLVQNLAGQLFAAPQHFVGPTPSAGIVPLADRFVGASPQNHFYSRYAKSLAAAFVAGAVPAARKWVAALTASMVAAKALFGQKQ